MQRQQASHAGLSQALQQQRSVVEAAAAERNTARKELAAAQDRLARLEAEKKAKLPRFPTSDDIDAPADKNARRHARGAEKENRNNQQRAEGGQGPAFASDAAAAAMVAQKQLASMREQNAALTGQVASLLQALRTKQASQQLTESRAAANSAAQSPRSRRRTTDQHLETLGVRAARRVRAGARAQGRASKGGQTRAGRGRNEGGVPRAAAVAVATAVAARASWPPAGGEQAE